MNGKFMDCPHCSTSHFYDGCTNNNCENGLDNNLAYAREAVLDAAHEYMCDCECGPAETMKRATKKLLELEELERNKKCLM